MFFRQDRRLYIHVARVNYDNKLDGKTGWIERVKLNRNTHDRLSALTVNCESPVR